MHPALCHSLLYPSCLGSPVCLVLLKLRKEHVSTPDKQGKRYVPHDMTWHIPRNPYLQQSDAISLSCSPEHPF